MSNTIEVNDTSFETEVLNSSKLVLVDFWATWCGPCRKLGPVLDEIAQSYPDNLKIVKVNADECKEVVKDNSISGLPSLLVFKDGKAVERMVGLMPKSTIINNIEKHL
ncbi:thioredoxin [bacterium]|nr:thioredoxin [bacterium]